MQPRRGIIWGADRADVWQRGGFFSRAAPSSFIRKTARGEGFEFPRTVGIVSGDWKGRAFNQHSLCWREEERVTTAPGKEAHSRIGLPLIGLKTKSGTDAIAAWGNGIRKLRIMPEPYFAAFGDDFWR